MRGALSAFLAALALLAGDAWGEGTRIVVRWAPTQDARDPRALRWRRVPRARIALKRQDVSPPYGGGSVPWVDIRALHDGQLVFFLLEWDDPTKDSSIEEVGSFRDAAAVMFPLEPDRPAEPHMGHRHLGGRNGVVNIWYFRADVNAVEDLNAAGPGTLLTQERQDVSGRGHHDGHRWRVVFWRRLRTEDEWDAQFRPGLETWLNVAVWDGGRGQRAGQKSISDRWHRLILERR